MINAHEYKSLLLVHGITPAGPIPMVQVADGCYPYETYYETSKRPELKYHQFVDLENDYIKVTICPDLGGKVYSIIHKASQKEVLFCEPIVRPIRILPRMFYVGGGIEVSFPISHSPVQIVPLKYEIKESKDRVFVYCGEKEIKFGMNFTVEFSLGAEDQFLTQRTYFKNNTPTGRSWMSWSNAGVPAYPDTEFYYPNGTVLEHSVELKMIDWEKEGPKKQSDIKNMAGWFWREHDCNAFGEYSETNGCGLYHIADPKHVPGIKLWSDGIGEHEAFVTQWTLSSTQCLEIQAGPIIDQGIKDVLKPGEDLCYVEFWIPTDKRLDIKALRLPNVNLPEISKIPLFGYARADDSQFWLDVIRAWKANDIFILPKPPGMDDNKWAPSGIEKLEEALKWAILHCEPENKSGWLFQLGTLVSALEKNEEGIKYLEASKDDRAYALASRLYRRCNKLEEAYKVISRIKNMVVAMHPQVVIERDRVLQALGAATIPEREKWFECTSGLTDEWLIERRAVLLIDKGEYEKAKELLESTQFQLVHQRYVRQELWKKIENELGLEPVTKLNWMGEDNLASFGAYWEYTEE